MRKYTKESVVVSTSIDKIICNMCGNEIEKNSSGYFQDHLHIEKKWGYFSNMDGECHCIDICEDCYKKIIENFCVSVKDI